MSVFDGSVQHHVPFANGNGHMTLTRCESCMYGSHFDEVTWHSWAGAGDMTADSAHNARIATQKCACDCAGAPGAPPS